MSESKESQQQYTSDSANGAGYDNIKMSNIDHRPLSLKSSHCKELQIGRIETKRKKKNPTLESRSFHNAHTHTDTDTHRGKHSLMMIQSRGNFELRVLSYLWLILNFHYKHDDMI